MRTISVESQCVEGDARIARSVQLTEQRRDDIRWLESHPARSFRLREQRPGDGEWPVAGSRHPLMTLLFFLHLRGRKSLCGLRVSRPDPDDQDDPWLWFEAELVAVRARSYMRVVRQIARDGGDPTADDDLLTEKIPNQSKEFVEWLSRRPLRLLREVSSQYDPAAYGIEAAPLHGTVFDDLPYAMQLVGLNEPRIHADAGLMGQVFHRAARTTTFQLWRSCERPLYVPTGALAERLINPDLLLDDQVPVTIPYAATLVDVSCLGIRLSLNGRDDEPLAYVGMTRLRTVSSQVAFLEDTLRPGEFPTAAHGRPRAECTQSITRLLLIGSDLGCAFINDPDRREWSTWSAWRARALSLPGAQRTIELLLSGLCYVLATRGEPTPQLGARPARSHGGGAGPLDRIRRYDVADDPSLEISETPIVREVSGPRGPLDTERLILTRTTHREYPMRVWTGPGRATPEWRVIQQGETRRWMKTSTLIAASTTPSFEPEDPE